MDVKIRLEDTDDRQSIWNVNQAAFKGDDEARLVDALREGGFIVVSLIAELDGETVGHILLSQVTILAEDGAVNAVALAPMAVRPQHQRNDIGTKLVNAGLSASRELGQRIAIVLGHPGFYSRFGFRAELARPLESPFGGGDAWMALELVSGALAGVEGRVIYSPPFGVFESS